MGYVIKEMPLFFYRYHSMKILAEQKLISSFYTGYVVIKVMVSRVIEILDIVLIHLFPKMLYYYKKQKSFFTVHQ